MEEVKTYKLGITFEIDVPSTVEESNLSTLILLMQRLVDIENYSDNYDMKIKNTNSTIADIENILECMKYKEEL